MHIYVSLPKFAQIRNWSHIPQKLSKLKNFVSLVLYTHFPFQNGISELLIINGSKVMLKNIIFQFLEVTLLS